VICLVFDFNVLLSYVFDWLFEVFDLMDCILTFFLVASIFMSGDTVYFLETLGAFSPIPPLSPHSTLSKREKFDSGEDFQEVQGVSW